MKRINPYTRLLNEMKAFCSKILYRHKKVMWVYPISKIDSTWNLGDLYQRAAAANQLGYEVHVIADKDGLKVVYVKELPEIPYEWK